MIFKNRFEAGEILAKRILEKYDGNLIDPVVVAIPRGGVEVAKPIVEKLNAPLTLIFVRKIGAPHNKELAIGSITERGEILINPDIREDLFDKLGITDDYIYSESLKELQTIRERKEKYKNFLPNIDLTNGDVILVDDGIATGLTTKAAILSLRELSPNRIILAVPVMPLDRVEQFKNMVDDLIVLHVPAEFYAVGQFYKDFHQVSDDEVVSILKLVND
jgi:predicted phosphoribosyltransferase